MRVVTSGKIQVHFGEIAEIAKFGEPVTITQYGHPTLLLMRYQDGMDALRQMEQKQLASWLDGREKTAPTAALNLSEDELNTLINEEIAK